MLDAEVTEAVRKVSSPTRVYLGGPINGCTDEEASGWRTEAKAVLEAAGFLTVDPMDRDYRGREMEPGIAAEIVELDKKDIDTCDVILVNSPKPSYGTAMEIMYAFERGKHIEVVVPAGQPVSPWIVYHADELHEGSVVAATEAIVEASR